MSTHLHFPSPYPFTSHPFPPFLNLPYPFPSPSLFPVKSRPLKSSYWVWGSAESSISGVLGAEPQSKSNLCI